MIEPIVFTAGPQEAGTRLDVFLAREMEGFTRSRVQKIIDEDGVKVNERIAKANQKLQPEDRVEVIVPSAIPSKAEPEDIPLDILYEDDQVIVVNKPRGMVVHPAAGNHSGTLVNALLKHCSLSGINGVIRPGIVHRLDKDTSGVMVAAKTDQAHLSLAKQIKDRTAGRRYLTIVHGVINEEQGVIEAPIGRHPTDRKKMAVVFANSKPAVTVFTVRERFSRHTLVECKLLTGRTHQIRVHMAYIGHPVVSDPKYGKGGDKYKIEGQALHSAELVFRHPVTGEELSFRAPLPDDMQSILTELRK